MLDPKDAARFNKKMNDLMNVADKNHSISRDVGNSTVLEMKRMAPVRTGRLKTNVEAELIRNGDKSSLKYDSVAIDPETGINYAPIQEFGGRLFPGRHYFYPAARRSGREVLNRLNKYIRSVFIRK